jgi:Fibronectin type III domain
MEVKERFFAFSLSFSFSVLLATVGSLWAGEIRISWQAPTTNEDNSTLTDLSNHRVHYGTVSRGSQTNPASFQYQSSTTLPASQTSHTLTGLTNGLRYYISVTAIDTAGNQSKYSLEVNDIAQDSSSVGTLPLLANFSNGTNDFGYSDISQGAYANGQLSSGALQISLGGVDNATITNMRGDWSWTFNLSSAATVTIKFDYTLTQTSEYEAGECSEVRATVDGMSLASGGAGYVARVCGNGNGGTAISTQNTFTTPTPLSLLAGMHTLRLEGYNSQKTLNDEVTTVSFDNVEVRTSGTASALVQTSGIALAPAQFWLEAESGQLTSPMAEGNDDAASAGQYVWAPESAADVGSTSQSGGMAQYTINVTTADTYIIWARVYPSADGSGAFYLQMDNDPFLPWDIPFPVGGGSADEEAVSITSPTNYAVATLQEGDEYYIDRTYMITALPPALNGLVAIKTANNDRDITSTTFLTLNLDEDATLYVAYDSRANPFPTWLTAHYTLTGLTISTTDVSLAVWERQVSAGTVTIPGNKDGNPGGVDSTYIVLLDFQGGGGNPTWRWYQVAQDTTPVFSLTSGTHTLTFKHRWSGTKLDRLLITNDLDFVPEN